MTNDGVYTLGPVQVTVPVTYVTDWVTDLDGMVGVTLQMQLAYGSGGTSIKAFLQTSLDSGQTAIDIASVTFATSGGTKVLNLSANSPVTTAAVPSDGALADNTVLDGILGDRLRLKVVSTGTYAGSTVLVGRVAVR
jgi:hypothetical protein